VASALALAAGSCVSSDPGTDAIWRVLQRGRRTRKHKGTTGEEAHFAADEAQSREILPIRVLTVWLEGGEGRA